MNELVDQNALGFILKILVIALMLVIFWLLEAVWRFDKRWIIPIIIFPPLLIVPVIKDWESTRARCFFGGTYFVLVLFISAVTGYDFLKQITILLRDISIWTYYLLQYLLQLM